MSTPYTIRTILDQLGGRGINGALAYVGGHQLGYKCPPSEGEYRSDYRSHEDQHGQIDYDVGLSFAVNGKRGQSWHMIVVYEPDDIYSVWIWRRASKGGRAEGKMGAVLDHQENVYCDVLQEVVEQMYDRAIKEYNQGFIPL